MTTTSRTRRLFFALWPTEAERDALVHAVRKAVRGSGGRPIPAENLHVTLAFLGSVPEERLAELVEAAGEVRFGPFDLVFDRIEHWPRSSLLCATPSVRSRAAETLARDLWQALAARNIQQPDPKPFRAHITLARNVLKPHLTGECEPVSWRIDRFALVESETLPQGSRYTILRSIVGSGDDQNREVV